MVVFDLALPDISEVVVTRGVVERWPKTKVIVLSKAPPRSVLLHWRPMGQGDYRQAPVPHAARGWYRAARAAAADFEYYVEVAPVEGDPVYWPATAPDLNQTVVVTAP